MTRIDAGTFDRALAGAFAVVVALSVAFAPALSLQLARVTLLLIVLYVIMRPDLAERAWAWCRPRALMVLLATLISLAGLATISIARDERLHPLVDAQGEAELWTRANLALGRIVAADLRWQAAASVDRDARVADVRRATRDLAEAVVALERVRPPTSRTEVHASATAIYRDLADLLEALPDVLARPDTDTAAAIWKRAGTLNREAIALIRLTAPDTAK